MKHLLIIILMVLFVCSCRKDTSKGKYSVSGRLVESSSNPIAIRNYKLQVYQRDDYGLFGGVPGIRKEFQTDADGFFSLTYNPEKSTGLSSEDAINTYPLSITGIDTNNYKGLYPSWDPITANKDTNMNTIFLFKKIEKFVRKVQFNLALAINDSLEVITFTAYRSTYNMIYGPVTAGTIVVLDTINQFKVERLDITSGSYYTSSVLTKSSYESNFNLTLPVGDEVYREQLLVYP